MLLDNSAYRVKGYEGIAWHYIKDETKPDEDTYWTGIEELTGNVVMVMVGDDRKFSFDPTECTSIDEEEYCSSCGQIGCAW
jgi:hypothetical protein